MGGARVSGGTPTRFYQQFNSKRQLTSSSYFRCRTGPREQRNQQRSRGRLQASKGNSMTIITSLSFFVVVLMVVRMFQGLDIMERGAGAGTGSSIAVGMSSHALASSHYQPQIPCWFPGNCPAGTACYQGKCHAYYEPSLHFQTATSGANVSITHPAKLESCLQTCLEELALEERFQYGSIPTLVAPAAEAKQPHCGCVLWYERIRPSSQTSWKDDLPTLATRLIRRYRSVQKVDNYSLTRNISRTQLQIWTAFCHAPCHDDDDCHGHWICRADVRRWEEQAKQIPKVCRPPSIQPMIQAPLSSSTKSSSPVNKEPSITYISGANKQYFKALENFAASLYYWAPTRFLSVYNLGMNEDQIAEIRRWPNIHAIYWANGFPSHFPPHVSKTLRNYAWKPLAIQDSLDHYEAILWIDAGATLVAPVEPMEQILKQEGVFLMKGQDKNMKDRSHPGTFRWYGYDKENFQAGPSFAGGIQGHLSPSPYIDTIVIPNSKCALDPLCVAPETATLNNHRFDQSSLSVLSYQPHVRARHYTEYLAAGRGQLAANLSEPSTPFIVWTARGRCMYYSDNHGFGRMWR